MSNQPLEVRPPTIQKKEGLNDIHPDLQPNFLSIIVGKPGSGKSHLLEELILNPTMYYRKFNKVFFVGKSGFNRVKLNEQNSCPYFDPNWMLEKVKENKGAANILFILDDVIGELKKKQNNPLLAELIFNRRHISVGTTISYIITTQKYMVCPPRIRSCATSLFFYKVQKQDYRKICEENIFEDIPKVSYILMTKHLTKPHCFVYIRLDTCKIYLNFKPLY